MVPDRVGSVKSGAAALSLCERAAKPEDVRKNESRRKKSGRRMGLMSRLRLYESPFWRVSLRRPASARSRRNVTVPLLLALLLAAACHQRPRSFVEELRCGMTRDQVRQLAREHGYDNSDAGWLSRREPRASKELRFVDLTFHGDRLVAYRVNRYD